MKDKGQLSRDAFWRIKDTLDRSSHDGEAKEAINWYRQYFCNPEWIAAATLEEHSNGVYIGTTNGKGERSGIGVYIFNDSDIYLGHWACNTKNGEGFYYSGGGVSFGEWSNGKLEQNGYDNTNRDGARIATSTSSSSSSGKGGCISVIVVLVILFFALRFLGCIDFS